MSSESTSTLVLRSPVQGRPAIAWAAVLSQGARGLEVAVTFLDSTVGGIALHLLDGTGLLDASKWGAWLWSHLWMEVADGVLHQECGWMREPIIGSRPCSEKDAAFELDQFPRDPQWVPEWMAVKAAAYHKEAEKWLRYSLMLLVALWLGSMLVNRKARDWTLGLIGRHKRVLIYASSIAFGCGHLMNHDHFAVINLLPIVPKVVFGLFGAYVTVRSNSIVPSWLFHAANNSVASLILYVCSLSL